MHIYTDIVFWASPDGEQPKNMKNLSYHLILLMPKSIKFNKREMCRWEDKPQLQYMQSPCVYKQITFLRLNSWRNEATQSFCLSSSKDTLRSACRRDALTGCEDQGTMDPLRHSVLPAPALIEQLGYGRQEVEETCFKSSDNRKKIG